MAHRLRSGGGGGGAGLGGVGRGGAGAGGGGAGGRRRGGEIGWRSREAVGFAGGMGIERFGAGDGKRVDACYEIYGRKVRRTFRTRR